jgi:hypothetical protein
MKNNLYKIQNNLYFELKKKICFTFTSPYYIKNKNIFLYLKSIKNIKNYIFVNFNTI